MPEIKNKEHKRIIDKIRALYIKSGAKLFQYPEMWGVDERQWYVIVWLYIVRRCKENII
jgi:hypothetical protein